MRFLAGFACASVLFLIPGADRDKLAGKPSRYTDGTYGYSIQSPAFPVVAKGSSAFTLFMMAPAEDKFSSNVSVMIQEVATTREEFRKLSLAQFEANGLKVLSDKDTAVSKKDALQLEYEGNQQGRDIHGVVQAVIAGERVYLVTCTALQGNYPKYEAAFKGCLESFELTR
jgi:hypothetical protein